MSSGSNPVTTIGTRYFSARRMILLVAHHRADMPRREKALHPVVRHRTGIASIAGGTSTCETSSEKFFSPAAAACKTAIAVAGAVVSKPTAKNTTSRSGCFAASFTASSGE